MIELIGRPGAPVAFESKLDRALRPIRALAGPDGVIDHHPQGKRPAGAGVPAVIP